MSSVVQDLGILIFRRTVLRWKISSLVSLCLLCILNGAVPAVAQMPDRPIEINLPAGDLANALDKLGDQSGLQIMYEPALAKDIKVTAVRGTLTVADALKALLAKTGLRADRVNDKTIVLKQVEPNTTSSGNQQDPPMINRAPQDSTGSIEEIVVSARLRQERLQDVPASIATASGQAIADQNIVSLTELYSFAPGLTFATDPGRFGTGPAIAIRGISTFTQSPAVQDSVAIVLDGIPVARAKGGAFPNITDVEQIEILRGPQGTLFGKNSSAGIIAISTKDPTPAALGEASFDYSTYDNRVIHVAASGPIINDLLLGRLSVFSATRNGYIDDIYNNTEWGEDSQKQIRAKLLYTASADDRVKLSLDFLQENNDAGTETVRSFLSTTPQYIRNYLTSIVGSNNDQIDARTVDSNGQVSSNEQRTGGAALQWDHSFGEYTLTALTGYRRWTQNSNSGTYNWWTPLNDGNTLYKEGFEQYSGEIRINSPNDRPIHFVGGLFAYTDRVTSSLYDPDPGLLVLSATGNPTGRQQRHWDNLTKSDNFAAFGEADADVTDRLTLTAGLRETHENDTVVIDGLPTSPGAQRIVVPLGTTSASANASKLTWRAGGKWKLDEDRMVYVSATSGFKGPGFNAVSGVLGNAQPVKPETSTSFEGGFKSQWYDRRLTLNLTGYYARYDDFQVQGFMLAPGTTVAKVVLSNAAKLKTQGFESDFAWRITDTFSLTANASLADATFLSYPGAPCYATQPKGPGQCLPNNTQDLSGKRLANAPKWAFDIGAKEEFAIPGWSWNGFLTADYNWRSSIQWDTLQNPLALEGSYGLLGASLGAISPDGKYSLKVYGKNLTDNFHTEGILVGVTITQFLPVDYSRVVGINFDVKF